MFFFRLIVATLPLIAALSLALTAAAQPQTPEVSTHDATPTFSTRSNLVIVRAVVRDNDGRATGTFQKEDFQVFDKGKPQFISRFAVEKNEPAKPAAAGAPGSAEQPKPAGEPVAPDRFVAYVFDDVHVAFLDLAQSRQAAIRHLQNSAPTTRSAIFTTSGRITQDFTDDLDKLRDTLNRIVPSPIAGPVGQDCPSVSYYQADLIQNKNDPTALQAATQDAILCARLDPKDTNTQSMAQSMAQAAASRVISMSEMETRVSIKVLADVVRRSSAMPGQRSIVVVSPGFLVLDSMRFEEMQLIDRALRANVTISGLNARGLFALTPGGDASQSGGNLGTLAVRSLYQSSAAIAEEDVMAELAAGTGGGFFHNSNDLEGGFRQIASPPEFYYVLGFSPENLKFDGSYHNLKVSLVKKFSGFTIVARRGYVAPKHEENAAEVAKQEIEEAFFTRDEFHDIPVTLETQFFKASDQQAKLSVLARVDVRQLHFQKADGRNVDTLTVISGVFDRNGNFVNGMEKTVDMKLKDDTLARRLNGGITVKSGFDVTPGSYFVRLIVRDSQGQKMAAINGAVEIP